MDNADEKKISISVPGEWALKKVLGPTLDTLGEDINKVYQIGRDKIIKAAQNKVKNIEDGASANLRVSRDVFWNGAFTDESICAEYFGGVLASSRSKDGKDDTGVYYVDLIKSLSSAQLKLHYTIYRSLNKLFISDPSKNQLNVGQSTELYGTQLYFASIELDKANLKIDTDLEALYRKGLLHEYKTNHHQLDEPGKILPYTMIVPTTLGIQLFAIANNLLSSWREFQEKDFGDFKDIPLPTFFAFGIDDLLTKAGLKKIPENNVTV